MSAALSQLEPFVQDTADTWSSIGPAEAAVFQRTAKRAFPSNVGPDGIPYSAYASSHGGKILQRQFFSQTAGLFLDTDFNPSEGALILKGDEPSDASGSTLRAPLGLRPVGMKNTDNKVIGKTVDKQF